MWRCDPHGHNVAIAFLAPGLQVMRGCRAANRDGRIRLSEGRSAPLSAVRRSKCPWSGPLG